MRTELDRALSNIDSVIKSKPVSGKYLYSYHVSGEVEGKEVSAYAEINGKTLAEQSAKLDGATSLELHIELMLDIPGAKGFSDERDESGSAGVDPVFSAVYDAYSEKVGESASVLGSDSMALVVEPRMEKATFDPNSKESARSAAELVMSQANVLVGTFEDVLKSVGTKATAASYQLSRSIYQVKTLEQGREVDASADAIKSFLMYPLTRKLDKVEVKSNYVAVASVEGELAKVMVVYGPDKGATMTVAREMLTKPDILPCFAGNGSRWAKAVEAMGKGLPSQDVENVINNAMFGRKKVITAAFNSDDVKDSVLSLKAIQEVCEPYLGPVGMVMALSVMKNRIFKEKA